MNSEIILTLSKENIKALKNMREDSYDTIYRHVTSKNIQDMTDKIEEIFKYI